MGVRTKKKRRRRRKRRVRIPKHSQCARTTFLVQMEGVITHELGHVLGLYHEQSRYDRDNFVTINWDKIPEMSRRNFELLAEDVMSNYGVPYDYKSIMHYGATVSSAVVAMARPTTIATK